MSADDEKVDPVADTAAGLTKEQVREMLKGEARKRKVKLGMATTQPQGFTADDIRDRVVAQGETSAERVTAPMRSQRPTSGRADTAIPAPTDAAVYAEGATVDEPIDAEGATVMGIPSPLIKRHISHPPSTWDRQNAVITSAQREHTKQTADNYSGDGVEAGNMRITEERAREIITSRFTAAGIALEADYAFHHEDLLVTLDGYDVTRRVGYAFLSHSDADVVTDFDEASELAFQELAGNGTAWVLVLHDADVPVAPALEERIDEFLRALPST